jgi:hypothetical protein
LSERSGEEEPRAPVWTEPTLEEIVSSLKKYPESKVVFLTCARHRGGVYGMRPDMATHGLLGLSAALRFGESALTSAIMTGEGELAERSSFLYFLIRQLRKDPKLTPAKIERPLNGELEAWTPLRLGLETTSTRLLMEPILDARFDPAWDLAADITPLIVFDEETGTLTVTSPRLLTRAGVKPFLEKTVHLILRCGVRAEGGVFADFSKMEDADLSDATLVDLPAEPGGRGFFDG